MIGEYGPENLRPHFHAILFGQDFTHDRIPVGTNEFGDKLYISPALERAWGQGHTRVGALSAASAAYVARYCVPRQHPNANRYRRTKDGREYFVRPEFATMSRRPGIGAAWRDKYKTDLEDDVTVRETRRVRTPRFYDTAHSSDELARIRTQRRGHALERKMTADELRVREEHAFRLLKQRGDL